MARAQLVVELSGGLVLSVWSDDPEVSVTVLDWDAINAGDDPPTTPFPVLDPLSNAVDRQRFPWEVYCSGLWPAHVRHQRTGNS